MNATSHITTVFAAIAAAAAFTLPAAAGDDATARAATPIAGAVIPGANVLSARVVTLVPVNGGETRSVPLAADGAFQASGLAPGRYRLAIRSAQVGRQTQSPTFGERVQAGLAQAGSAVAQGAALKTKHDTVKNSINNVRREGSPGAPESAGADAPNATAQGLARTDNSMPNRISMNVTVGRQQLKVDVDGEPAEVEVGPDGSLTGVAVTR